jgi:hypothetical protein
LESIFGQNTLSVTSRRSHMTFRVMTRHYVHKARPNWFFLARFIFSQVIYLNFGFKNPALPISREPCFSMIKMQNINFFLIFIERMNYFDCNFFKFIRYLKQNTDINVFELNFYVNIWQVDFQHFWSDMQKYDVNYFNGCIVQPEWHASHRIYLL